MPLAMGNILCISAHEDTSPKVGFIPWALYCHFRSHFALQIYVYIVYSATKGLFCYPKFRFEYFFCPAHIHTVCIRDGSRLTAVAAL